MEQWLSELTEGWSAEMDSGDQAKDIRDIKTGFEFERQWQGTEIITLAVAANDDDNGMVKIPCQGKPISLATYNVAEDSYVVYCCDYRRLGSVPVNYILTVKQSYDWETPVPLPPKMIRRYLTPEQLADLDEFTERHGNCEIEFLQMLKVEV